MNKRTARVWANRITKNYNKDIDTNMYGQLVDAAKELKLDMNVVDRRWQDYSPGEKAEAKDVFYLLTGRWR